MYESKETGKDAPKNRQDGEQLTIIFENAGIIGFRREKNSVRAVSLTLLCQMIVISIILENVVFHNPFPTLKTVVFNYYFTVTVTFLAYPFLEYT